MKKVALFAAAICFVMVSCCNQNEKSSCENNQEQVQKTCHKHEGNHQCCQMSEEQKAACEAFKEEWGNWDNLSDDAKKELVAKAKDRIDEKEAKMQAHKEAMEAKKAEAEAKWANFDNLSLDEQKALIDCKMQCKKGRHHDKHACKSECKDKCKSKCDSECKK